MSDHIYQKQRNKPLNGLLIPVISIIASVLIAYGGYKTFSYFLIRDVQENKQDIKEMRVNVTDNSKDISGLKPQVTNIETQVTEIKTMVTYLYENQ